MIATHRIYILAVTVLVVQEGLDAAVEEICDGEVFEGRCSDGYVIQVNSARYGRIEVGQCISRDLGFLGCGKDALAELDEWCSGKPSCRVVVDKNQNPDLNEGNTCFNDIVSHLRIEYECVKVYHKDRCTGPEVSVPAGQGVLSSSVSDSTGCGSMASPWSIKLAPGQRLSLSLVDFGWGDHSSGGVGQNRCDPYAYVVEKAVAVNQSVCGGGDRQRHVYTSTSSHVLIQTVPARHRNAEFLLYFTAEGCADITPPAHAWYKRHGESAVIGCQWSEHSWHLKCEGSTWMGVVGNCSESETPMHPTEPNSIFLSPVLSIGIITGLGVLILALLCILCIGCICMRKRQSGATAMKTSTLTGQQQACLYHPGRPVPLTDPQATLAVAAPGGPAEESLHIWEQPLPQKPIPVDHGDTGTYQNQSLMGTLPYPGTMTGPPAAGQRLVNAEQDSQPGTWKGTKTYYDAEKGWVAVPQNM